MKNLVLPFFCLGMVLFSCSKDDDSPKCDSCTLSDGSELNYCDNNNGTYAFKYLGETETITDDELDDLGLTYDEFVLLSCTLGGD
nr:hypothetical protein [Allomuricauda sp.]